MWRGSGMPERIPACGGIWLGCTLSGSGPVYPARNGHRRIRFVLELPDPEDFRYTNHSPPKERSACAQQDAHDQACRQRRRALLLVIKAKLEAVTAGISTIETEFLANIVLPDNTTAGEWMIPQIDQAYRTGEMPPLLPAAGNSDRRSTGPIPLPPA